MAKQDAKQALQEDEAITQIKTIFGTSTRSSNYVNYTTMNHIAKGIGKTSVDFTSLNNQKHQGELVTIVNDIFTKVSKPTADNVLHLNQFLLKLPEAGLSKEALEGIYNKYKEIFGKHIAFETVDANNVVDLEKAIGYTGNANPQAITLHKNIMRNAKSFITEIEKEIKDAASQSTVDTLFQIEELKADNIKLKNNLLSKAFNKDKIDKNILKIEELENDPEVKLI